MATMVCQGLQSCLDTEPRKFRLKLSSPRTHFSDNLAFIKPLFEEIKTSNSTSTTAAAAAAVCSNDDKVSADMGGWTFLQSLSSSRTREEEKPYVHPMTKRSLSSLSAKSLELCTENLGSETGSSDMLDDGDTIFNVQQETNFVSPCRRQLCRASTTREFPPPLTTISGSSPSPSPSVRMMAHREGGRLVIEAVKVPSRRSIFKAERSNGRLRLLLAVENEEADDQAGDTDEMMREKEEAVFCDEEEDDEFEDEEGVIDEDKVKVGGETETEKKHKGVSESGSGRYREGEHESENNKVYY